MILIDGPDDNLCFQVRKQLQKLLPTFDVQVSGQNRQPRMADFINMLNKDHRHVIRDGFNLPTHFNKAQCYMLTMGLASSGSVYVFCGMDFTEQQIWLTKEYAYLPSGPIINEGNLETVVAQIVERSTAEILQANKVWHYNSLGGIRDHQVMLVGDRVSPFYSYDAIRKMAFFSPHGSSIFLHDALQQVDSTYYLTNAYKTNSRKQNQMLLAEEIDLVKPVKIVGMGEEAHRTLSDIGATFVRTYHPQYWVRFKNKDLDELVSILRP